MKTIKSLNDKVVVLHSGGLDSTALLYHFKDSGFEVLPLSINYGQRHVKEIQAAMKICTHGGFEGAGVDLRELGEVVMQGSSQTDSSIEVPEGHYAADNMKTTVVANRNMILLSIATAYAISEKASLVAYAAHAGDHDQYPDCRQVFIDALSKAIELCDYNPPKLVAPYAGITKAQVVTDGANHNAPFELTWSCYKGGGVHCGRCGTCVERAEAFAIAGVPDPTEYMDPEFWKTVVKK